MFRENFRQVLLKKIKVIIMSHLIVYVKHRMNFFRRWGSINVTVFFFFLDDTNLSVQ